MVFGISKEKVFKPCLRKKCLKVIMAMPISTPVLVEDIKEPQPEFKIHPTKAGEINMIDALSSVPSIVLLVEDIRSYIHYKLEELGEKFIRKEFKGLCVNDQFKVEYLPLKTKGLSNAIDFPDQSHFNWVRYVLSKVHDQFLWLEAQALIKITTDVIQRVTRFSAIGEALNLRKISSTEVTRLTKSQCTVEQ